MSTKKIILAVVSVVLVLAIAIGLVAVLFNANSEKYISKGQFYELLINNFNYYSLTHSKEEIAETPNYTLEAETMVQWDLLPESIATTNIDEPITREVAALACLNTLYIKKTGDVNSIKDADLCDYPQEMADALANGIITLDNGYLDAKEKLSRDECVKLLELTQKAKCENKYEENAGSVKVADSAISFSGEDLLDLAEGEFVVEGYEEADDAANSEPVQQAEELSGSNYKANIVNLSWETGGAVCPDVIPLTDEIETIEFRVNVPKDFYNRVFKNCEVGQLVEYTGLVLLDQQPVYNGNVALDYQYQRIEKITPFAGKLKKVIDWEERGACPANWTSEKPCVTLVLEAIDDIDKMANKEVSNITHYVNNIEFDTQETEHYGFKITVSPNKTKTGVEVTATRQFDIKYSDYENWRDQTESPVVTLTATLKDIEITTNDLQNFYKKSGTAYFRVKCTTTESFELESAGMRLTPDSNRNGKFWSNLTNSRFTNGKGAKAIKVGDIPIKLPYGFSIDVYVYLCIAMDGKITIAFEQIDNGFEMEKCENGEIKINKLKAVEKSEQEVAANLNIELKAEVFLNFKLVPRRSIVGGDLAGGIDIAAQMALYEQVDDEMRLDRTGYGDPEEASREIAAEKKYSVHYCVDVSATFYFRCGMIKHSSPKKGGEDKNNLLYVAADWFDYDITKWAYDTRTNGDGPRFHFHYENGGFVSECTIGNTEEVFKDEDAFALSSYKVHINDNMCGIVYITDSPISEKEIDKNNGIKVRSKNSNVAKVYYHKKNNSITIEAVSAGSTEVEVYIQKDKTSDKMYVQTFSVTIYPTTEEQTEYSVEGVSIVIPKEFVIYEGYYV